MTPVDPVAAAWEREYAAGRYRAESQVRFVDDIIAATRALGLHRGIYIGCGNGRNYVPLVEAGLDLIGLDISATAIDELRERCPDRRDRLVCGSVDALPASETYDVVVGIQVFQHGDRAAAHRLVREAQARVRRGGLMAVRVNATETEVVLQHELLESGAGIGFTVRYLEGSKEGLAIHFYERDELASLFEPDFEVVLEPRLVSNPRVSPGTGQWSQWEAIWRRSWG
jgi:SAM-dependent methyltransferase